MEQWYYYEYARRASRHVDNHPGLNYLKNLAQKANSILDFGCGEGTRLNTLLPSSKTGTGVDISIYAIKQAKKQYPRHRFIIYDGQTLPFKDQTFDLVYTAFVLEHTTNPEQAVREMLRVLQPGGQLVILCPNFGAPNRRSPNSIENPYHKLLRGFWRDLRGQYPNSLHWTKVTPKKKYVNLNDDTCSEPYLGSLLRFLEGRSFRGPTSRGRTSEGWSLWELDPFSLNPRKAIIAWLGKKNIYPFKYWGPQIFLAVQK